MNYSYGRYLFTTLWKITGGLKGRVGSVQPRYKYILTSVLQTAIWLTQQDKAFPHSNASQGTTVLNLGPHFFISHFQYRAFLLSTGRRKSSLTNMKMQLKATLTRHQGTVNYSRIWIAYAAGVQRWQSRLTGDPPGWARPLALGSNCL